MHVQVWLALELGCSNLGLPLLDQLNEPSFQGVLAVQPIVLTWWLFVLFVLLVTHAYVSLPEGLCEGAVKVTLAASVAT